MVLQCPSTDAAVDFCGTIPHVHRNIRIPGQLLIAAVELLDTMPTTVQVLPCRQNIPLQQSWCLCRHCGEKAQVGLIGDLLGQFRAVRWVALLYFVVFIVYAVVKSLKIFSTSEAQELFWADDGFAAIAVIARLGESAPFLRGGKEDQFVPSGVTKWGALPAS